MNTTSKTDPGLAMLAAIIESSEDAIISKDLNSRVTSWNKSAERLFGYSSAEMIGELIHKLIPQDRLSEEDDIISKLKRGERVEHFETRRVNKWGNELDISLTISPIYDDAGKVIGASKIARDITEEKQTRKRLHILNDVSKNINRILDVETILQIVTDAGTRVCDASFGAFFYNKVDEKGEAYMLYALSGAPREAFDKFGMPGNTAVFAPTFDGTGVVRSADITKDPRYGHNSPHHGMPAGHLPVVSYLAVPVLSYTGVVIGGLFFGHQLANQFTEEHESVIVSIAAQAAIALDNARLLQEVQMLNTKKDQFIGFASHELRTPLTTLKGYVSLASAGALPVEDLIKRISPQVERLEGIIADLLDISKIRAGKMDLTIEKVRLLELIAESCSMVDLSRHHFSASQPAEEIVIEADRQKMSQVLVNLLSNAVKYSAASTAIKLTVTIMGQEFTIQVADEGYGIPANELGKIFDQYYRVANPEKKPKGTGLGLFICKEIVEAHAGKIWAESEAGKGSIFYVSFPLFQRKNMANH